MSQENDYYKILGINSESSDSEIKKAYRGLSMKYHPDRNVGNSQVEEKFKEINQAYEILGDRESRRRYDLTKNNPFINFTNNLCCSCTMDCSLFIFISKPKFGCKSAFSRSFVRNRCFR